MTEYYYYMGIIFPDYTEQCSYDMANASYAMMNVMDPKNMWAVYSKLMHTAYAVVFSTV